MTPLNAAILVISDTAYLDKSTDKTGAILTKSFEDASNDVVTWRVVHTDYVPDNHAQIQEKILAWTDNKHDDGEKINLVVTSGGTGFSKKDHTWEAVNSLIEKPGVGLVHAMLSVSLSITPFAAMANPTAGVRGETVIITLPGSPKGAKENLEAIIKLLPHACIQAAGIQDSRSLHACGVKKLEEQAGLHGHGPEEKHKHGSVSAPVSSSDHNHHCHHHHHHSHSGHDVPKTHTVPVEGLASKLDQPVTRRHRFSPYPMISVQEAKKIIADNTPIGEHVRAAVNPDIVGSVLAEDVYAAEDVPAFRASIVDGYAIIAEDAPGVYPVVYISHAAPTDSPASLQRGQIARVTTGAPIPLGANAVVMVEDTVIASTTTIDGREEEKEIQILASNIAIGENIREVGSDVKKGNLILRKGDEITTAGGELGILTSVGIQEVKVYRKPVVGVLSTGNEVVSHLKLPLELGEVRDSNKPTLIAAIKSWGFEVLDLGIANDSSESVKGALTKALVYSRANVIITTGGVSMGELDLLKPTIEALDGTIHFGRVAMKPGKPTTFATFDIADPITSSATSIKQSQSHLVRKVIFALPGNPASALVTFHLFVLPSLRRTAGFPSDLPIVKVIIDHDVHLDPRPEYHRVRVRFDFGDGKLHAESTGGQRSSRVGSLKGANGLLCLPSSQERKTLPKGDEIETILIGQIYGGTN